MDKTVVQTLTNHFDGLSQHTPDEGIEFWFARDLMEPLGYARWENFQTAINRAIESCETTGYAVSDHFRGVTKMIEIGKGGQRQVDDFMLTRYACYLIAQNGDPRKEAIAFAQSYFAIQARKAWNNSEHQPSAGHNRRFLPFFSGRPLGKGFFAWVGVGLGGLTGVSRPSYRATRKTGGTAWLWRLGAENGHRRFLIAVTRGASRHGQNPRHLTLSVAF